MNRQIVHYGRKHLFSGAQAKFVAIILVLWFLCGFSLDQFFVWRFKFSSSKTGGRVSDWEALLEPYALDSKSSFHCNCWGDKFMVWRAVLNLKSLTFPRIQPPPPPPPPPGLIPSLILHSWSPCDSHFVQSHSPKAGIPKPQLATTEVTLAGRLRAISRYCSQFWDLILSELQPNF